MRIPMSVCAGLSAVVLLSADAAGDWLVAALCTADPAVARHPVRRASSGSGFVGVAYGAPSTDFCAPPSGFHSLPQVSGSGDLSVPLTVMQGTGIGGAPALCYVSRDRATGQPVVNPVIRVQQGQNLAIALTSQITNDDSTATVNCAMQTYVDGGDCAQPEAGFVSKSGPDGAYYPLAAVVPMIADGVTNLHTHGFAASPAPCHDEVIQSALYPSNWGGATPNLYPCQSAPNALNYTYSLATDHPAGAYWYHSHRHGQEEAQQMMGESGAIVLEGDEDRLLASRGVTDEVLMIRDIPSYLVPGAAQPAPALPHRRALAQRKLAAAAAAPAQANAAMPVVASADPRIDRANEVICASDDPDTGGPAVTRLTLNGALVPETPAGFPADPRLLTKTMPAGSRQLWRIVNASSQTALSPQLTLVAGHTSTVLPLTIVARDGVPLHRDDGTRYAEVRDTTKAPLLVPEAGRVEILVNAPPAGATLYLDSQLVAGGCASDGNPARRLLRVVSSGTGTAVTDDSDLQPAGKETQFVNMLSDTPSASRTLAFTEFPRAFTVQTSGWIGAAPHAGQFDPSATDFYFTQISSSDGQGQPVAIRPFDVNGPPAIVVHLNGRQQVLEEWLVQNYTLERHTFHIHQTHFRDITAGATGDSPVLDTVVVPAASRIASPLPGMDMAGAPGFVRLRMLFTRADIGTFVFHCHIGEHVDNGMMQTIQVTD